MGLDISLCFLFHHSAAEGSQAVLGFLLVWQYCSEKQVTLFHDNAHLCSPKASGSWGNVGYWYSKHSCRQLGIFSYSAGSESKMTLCWMPHLCRWFVRSWGLHKNICEEFFTWKLAQKSRQSTRDCKRNPPKRWKTVFMLNSNEQLKYLHIMEENRLFHVHRIHSCK